MSGWKNIGYTILGYAIAGTFSFPPLFLNTLAMFFAIMFNFSTNNYYDWKIQKEKNFLGEQVERGKIKEKNALLLCFLPLIGSFLIMGFSLRAGLIGFSSIYLFLILVLVTIFYAFPPIRLKKRKIIGFLAVSLGTCLFFLQGYFVLGKINLNLIFFAILLSIFLSYLEVLHTLEDSLIDGETKKMSKGRALKLLKILPLSSFVLASIFAFSSPIFLITAFFSVIRLVSLNDFKIEDIWRIRRNVFSFQLSFYEFFLYGSFGVFQMINLT